MKAQVKNKCPLVKKTMNATANFVDAVKSHNRKSSWKSKTSKMNKTLTGKTLTSKPNVMTEDDIQRLFRNNSKEKQNVIGPTKVSTQVGDMFQFPVINPNRDFIQQIKFLRVDDDLDKLLSGISQPNLYEYNYLSELKEQSEEDLTTQFKKNYLVGKIVGQGAYASVRVAIYKPKQQKVALKIYQKSKIKDPQRKKSVRREIKILQLLNHPNIVKIYDVVQTNNHLNIAMEYLSGLSLGTYLKAQPNGKIGDKNCKKIFRKLVKALDYMHSLNVAHRDIKLENIILDQDLNPKLIDFGFSTCIESSHKMKIFCGTPSYMAPEVVQRKEYRGETADIWALGVLLFVSLTGLFPFKGSTDEELFKKISVSDFPRSELFYNKQALDLIDKMLRVNVEQRMNAHEILSHQWFSEGWSESSKKKITQHSLEARKRVFTLHSNTDADSKSKAKKRQKTKEEEAFNKTDKIFLAETCKQNLHLQLRLALKSPSNNRQVHSFRKKKEGKEDKQNIKLSLKNEKSSKGGKINNFLKDMGRQEAVKKKQKLLKTQPKVIDLLRMEIKKRQGQNSKSKNNTHRN